MSCAFSFWYLTHLFSSLSRDLLPTDFVVYTYNEEGSLLSDRPSMQVLYLPLETLHSFSVFSSGSLDCAVAVPQDTFPIRV